MAPIIIPISLADPSEVSNVDAMTASMLKGATEVGKFTNLCETKERVFAQRIKDAVIDARRYGWFEYRK